MPFAVTQWADEPDPRAPDYIIAGWNVGQLSPWKWIVQTTGATGTLAVFNAGVLCHNVFNNPTTGIFVVDVVLPDDLALIFSIAGTQLPAGGPPTFTIHFHLEFFWLTNLLYEADDKPTYPTAIQVHDSFTMTEHDTSRGTFPNPIELQPAKWNVAGV